MTKNLGFIILIIAEIALGLILEFAPLLLLSISPPLASTATVTVGALPIPQNNLLGFLFISFGIISYIYVTREKTD